MFLKKESSIIQCTRKHIYRIKVPEKLCYKMRIVILNYLIKNMLRVHQLLSRSRLQDIKNQKIRRSNLNLSANQHKVLFPTIRHSKYRIQFKNCIKNLPKWAFQVEQTSMLLNKITNSFRIFSNNQTGSLIKIMVSSKIIMTLRFKFNSYKINWFNNSNKCKY